MDGQPSRGWLTETLLSYSVNLILSAVVVVYAISVARGGVAFRPGSISQRVGALLSFSLVCGLAAFGTRPPTLEVGRGRQLLRRFTPSRLLADRRA